MPRLVLVALTLFSALCQGFELSFQAAPHVTTNDTVALSVCAVLQCSETLADVPGDHRSNSRQITALTLFRRGSGDGPQWKQVSTVNTATPTDHRVSDGRRIRGQLTGRQANITVGLLKAVDCLETQFSCVAVLADDNGQNTEMKSFVGGKDALDLDPTPDAKDSDLVRDSRPASMITEQFSSVGEVKQLVASLWEKLDCIEKRLENSDEHDTRLEDKIETLKTAVTDKIDNLENILQAQMVSSSRQLEDRMDRLENRLEDKLWQVRGGNPGDIGDKDVQGGISSQLQLILESVQSTNTNISELYDQVKGAATGSSSTPGVGKSDNITSLVSGMASLATTTKDLVSTVDALRTVCAGEAGVPVEEFFDVLGTGKKEWRLAFRGTAYNNVKIYPAYSHGTGIPVEVEAGCKQFNHSLPCVNHYRNRDAFDNWVNIDEVLLAVFDKGRMVKRIVFNGHGSTTTSWFEASRVILSSWDDLKTKSHNFFSIEGETRPQYMRRFFINFDYTTCDKFGGWFFVGEALDGGCLLDKTIARPFIQYATGSTMAVWESSNVARADAFGVFLKYE